MPLQSQISQLNKQVVREPFKWLFVAFFEDGHIIEQDWEDRCISRTNGTGSTFTDVLDYHQNVSPLICFELRHVDKRQAVTVDLRNGVFIVNGTPMHLANQDFDSQKYKLELVYFRETRVEKDVTGVLQEDGSISEQEGDTRHYVNRYFIGWTTRVNGKNKQVTIAVG